MPTVLAELRSTQEELAILVESATQIQDRLSKVIRESENEASSFQKRLKDLESEGEDMNRELKGIWALNQELQESSRKIVDTRNAANRKTRHAWNVIRDLMDERKIGLSTDAGASSISDLAGRRQRQRIVSSPEAMSETSNAGSDKTVRPRQRTSSEVSRQEKRKSPSHAIATTEGSELTNRGLGGSSASGGTWKIHYSEMPLASVLAVGPLSWEAVAERLKLDEDAIKNFRSLTDIQTLGMRIQILKDAKVVFVHDPILLQDKSDSYLIDWGEKDRNASAKAYIRQNSKNTDPILHTFLYPVKKDAWFYVGAMSWKPIDIGWTVWATLSAKSRNGLVSKMKSRCGGNLTMEEIAALMEGGMLNELVVQIKGEGFKESSRTFAKDTLGSRKPDTS